MVGDLLHHLRVDGEDLLESLDLIEQILGNVRLGAWGESLLAEENTQT